MPDLMKKFYRLTDLFTRGTEIVIGEGEDAMVLWVAHLNSFDRAEVQKDGAAARARRLHTLRPTDNEMVIIEQTLAESTRDQLIDQLLRNKSNDHYVKAYDDIRTDKVWREKIDALERGDEQLRDQGDAADEQEIERLSELNTEYLEEMSRRQAQFKDESRAELENLEDEEIKDAFRESIRQHMASLAWMDESRISEIFYSLRECNSPVGPPFDHSSCDHSVRLCPTRADVRRLPDVVVDRARDAIIALSVPIRDAGNSAAPRSSSASSERQDVAEESTVSTPTAT